MEDSYEISVTAEDIARGKRGSCGECPIALAVARALGKATDVKVTCVFAYIRHNLRDATTVYALPGKATRFIDAFDDGEPVEPFTFTMTKTSG